MWLFKYDSAAHHEDAYTRTRIRRDRGKSVKLIAYVVRTLRQSVSPCGLDLWEVKEFAENCSYAKIV